MTRNEDAVRAQYAAPDNLRLRMNLHAKYSTAKEPYWDFVYRNLPLFPGARALELGCGDGALWRGRDLAGVSLTLTDLSEGMLAEAKKAAPGAKFAVRDAQNIAEPDGAFDLVIANSMLYHLPDLPRALGEIRRALAPGGALFAATFGENGLHSFLRETLGGAGAKIERAYWTFTLQNGREALERFFPEVEMIPREDSLRVTDAGDLADYALSMSAFAGRALPPREDLIALFESKKRADGAIHIPKEYGIFIARKAAEHE